MDIHVFNHQYAFVLFNNKTQYIVHVSMLVYFFKPDDSFEKHIAIHKNL